jgi:endonuclease/exonuclease/phosphatase family metal-dependent hydrolase
MIRCWQRCLRNATALSGLLLLLLNVAAMAQSNGAGANPLTVVTANVRFGTADDGPNHWDHRRETLVAALRDTAADLIGTQEMLPFQAEYIRQQLEGYDYYGHSRELDNRDGEQCGVYVRRDRFVVLEVGHFWLSDAPEIPGSRSWDSSLPRMATWAKLFDRRLGRNLIFVNTHFDHRGADARRRSAELLRSFVTARAAEYPVIVTGDFNCGEDSPPYRALLHDNEQGASPLVDVYRQLHPERRPDEGTYNGFEGRRSGDRIDWILSTRDFAPKSAEILAAPRDGRYASDHFFVRAQLDFTGPAGRD